MNAETIAVELGRLAVELGRHEERLLAVEEFVADVRKTLNKILVGLLLAAFAAIVDLAVRR